MIYDELYNCGADAGTFDEFNKWLYKPGKEGYINRRRVYDEFNNGGADVGENYEEFSSWLFNPNSDNLVAKSRYYGGSIRPVTH